MLIPTTSGYNIPQNDGTSEKETKEEIKRNLTRQVSSQDHDPHLIAQEIDELILKNGLIPQVDGNRDDDDEEEDEVRFVWKSVD